MNYRYKNKIVKINFDGQQHIGFVSSEVQNYNGDICIGVLLQKTAQTIYFDTRFGKPQIIWEE